MKNALNKTVENHISQNATLINDDIIIQKPINLMSPKRLDLGLKLFYLNYEIKLFELSNSLYQKTIEIITNFSFKEYSESSK